MSLTEILKLSDFLRGAMFNDAGNPQVKHDMLFVYFLAVALKSLAYIILSVDFTLGN